MQESLDNILNQIKVKHRSFQVQSNRSQKVLNIKQDEPKLRAIEGEAEGYVPRQLIKGNKGNFSWFLIHGRNSYSIYPIIQSQSVGKKKIEAQSFRLKTDNFRVGSSKEGVQKVKKLPYLKNGVKKSTESLTNKIQISGNIKQKRQELRNLNFLQKALKVHRKVISTIPTKLPNKCDLQENLFKQNQQTKMLRKKKIKQSTQEVEGEICSWLHKQELESSFQTLIF